VKSLAQWARNACLPAMARPMSFCWPRPGIARCAPTCALFRFPGERAKIRLSGSAQGLADHGCAHTPNMLLREVSSVSHEFPDHFRYTKAIRGGGGGGAPVLERGARGGKKKFFFFLFFFFFPFFFPGVGGGGGDCISQDRSPNTARKSSSDRRIPDPRLHVWPQGMSQASTESHGPPLTARRLDWSVAPSPAQERLTAALEDLLKRVSAAGLTLLAWPTGRPFFCETSTSAGNRWRRCRPAAFVGDRPE